MIILATPRFTKTIKIITKRKKSLDQAVSVIIKSPEIVEMKKGDLSGIRVLNIVFCSNKCYLPILLVLIKLKLF